MRLAASTRPLWLGREFTASVLLRYIGAHKVVRHNPIDPHRMPCWELGLVENGALDLRLDTRHVRVPAGHVVIIPPRTLITSAQGMNAGVFYWVGLDPERALAERAPAAVRRDLVRLRQGLRQAACRPLPATDAFRAATRRALELARDRSASVLARSGWAGYLAATVLDLLDHQPHTRERDDALIEPALRLMHDQLAAPLTIDQLAGACRLSRATFCETFRRVRGVTPHAFLTGLRIRQGEVWLRQPGASVSDVAQRLGYSSAQYFSAVFRQYTGQSPGTLLARPTAPPRRARRM